MPGHSGKVSLCRSCQVVPAVDRCLSDRIEPILGSFFAWKEEAPKVRVSSFSIEIKMMKFEVIIFKADWQ